MGEAQDDRYAILIPATMLISPACITLTYTASSAFQMGIDVSSEMLPQLDQPNDALRARVEAGYKLLVFHDLTPAQRQVLDRVGATVIEPLADSDSPCFRAAAAIGCALGRACAQHLIRFGRQRLAYVHAEANGFLRLTQLRYAGVLQECVGRGIKAPQMICCAGDLAEVAHALFLRGERGEAFDGFVCHGDVAAMRAVAALRMIGQVVPYDASVIGVGDTSPAALFSPPITSVSIDYRKLGVVLGTALVATLRGSDFRPPAPEWLDGIIHIVPRDSA